MKSGRGGEKEGQEREKTMEEPEERAAKRMGLVEK